MKKRWHRRPGAFKMTGLMESQATKNYYKHCPGEEHVKISNAICHGRRRSHYPKCHGCQFNDDEKGATPVGAFAGATVGSPSVRSESISSGAPSQLAQAIASLFHHSDINGTVPSPLSEDVAWRIGHATGQFLRSKLRGYDRADPNARSIVVGRDPREHGEMLEKSLIEGIRATGTEVVSLGVIDTPQLYFAVNHYGNCGGVQISGGHRDAHSNGMRICGAKAIPIGIETGLASIRDIAIRVPKHQSGYSSRMIVSDLSEEYLQYVREFMIARVRLPRPVKVVVDASNGAAGRWLPILFKGMRNLRIIRINFDHKGVFAHDPNPLKAKNTRALRSKIRQHAADFGVCFDSGAERCVFIDERGRTCRSELMAALLARQLIEREPGSTIVLDHRSSIAAEEEVVRAGGGVIRERVGSAFIKKTMSERNAIFGSNLSGCFFFRDNAYCESGILALVHVINLLLCTRRRLSELIRPLVRYSSTGELRYNNNDPELALNQITKTYQDASIEQIDGLTVRYPDWWFNVRPHESERLLTLTLEARSKKIVDQRLSELQPILGDRT